MRPTEIRIAGLAEQGVILLAKTIAKALVTVEGTHAMMTQDVDTSAEDCSTQIIVSNEPIVYHHVSNPDILVVMSQQSHAKFAPGVKAGGLILLEQDLVHATGVRQPSRVYGVPAMRLAEETGNRALMNIVMLGSFAAVADVLPFKTLRKALESSVPSAFRRLNLKAFDKGYEYGTKKAASGLSELSTPALRPCRL